LDTVTAIGVEKYSYEELGMINAFFTYILDFQKHDLTVRVKISVHTETSQ
jgi:hypothetical protein